MVLASAIVCPLTCCGGRECFTGPKCLIPGSIYFKKLEAAIYSILTMIGYLDTLEEAATGYALLYLELSDRAEFCVLLIVQGVGWGGHTSALTL